MVFPLPPLLAPDEDALPELAAPELLAFEPDELALPELAPPELASPELPALELAPPELALPELPALELAPPELALPELPALELAPPELALPELWPLELAPLELLEAEPPLEAELVAPLELPVLLEAELRITFEDAFMLVPIAPESVTVASATPPENKPSSSAYSDALAALMSRSSVDRVSCFSRFIPAVYDRSINIALAIAGAMLGIPRTIMTGAVQANAAKLRTRAMACGASAQARAAI